MAQKMLASANMTRAVMCAAVVVGTFGCGGNDAEVLVGGQDDMGSAERKIVGGSSTTINTVPWQVAMLTSRGSQYCGGSIIAPNWVLTAAHCGTRVGHQVAAGVTRLSALSAGQVRTVAQVITFPGYVTSERGKDAALVRLSEAFDLSGPNASAVATATPSDAARFAAGAVATISGWGTLRSGGSSPDTLQRTEVDISTDAAVRSAYGQVTSDQIGAARSGRDTCQGDSGGPLVIDANGSAPLLVGITSYGNGCAAPGFPGMYARVSSFATWIAQNVGTVTPPPPNPTTQTLLNSQNLSAAINNTLRGTITVPAGAQKLTVVMRGGTGDADLYVRAGAAPTTTTYDCRPYTDGPDETCTFNNPTPGTWHIAVRAYTAFSGVSVVATVP
jgi:secreted trypsin-like serine protease